MPFKKELDMSQTLTSNYPAIILILLIILLLFGRGRISRRIGWVSQRIKDFKKGSQKNLQSKGFKKGFQKNLLSFEDYQKTYEQSISDPDLYWQEQAQTVDWLTPFSKVKEVSFDADNHRLTWFPDGVLNACYNCVDRHLKKRGQCTAITWVGNRPGESATLTYAELHDQVCRLANGLRHKGVKKGDVVTIYMPNRPETAVAMLACARIGAIHHLVFDGLPAAELRERLQELHCQYIITASVTERGEDTTFLKKQVNQACTGLDFIKCCVVVKNADNGELLSDSRDVWYHELVERSSAQSEIEPMSAQDPLFIAFWPTSLGKNKAFIYNTGGYLVGAITSYKTLFRVKDNDVFWATSNMAWIAGHTYLLYGPLLSGHHTLIFDGIPTYPDCSRYWQIIDEHKVTHFYTSPTAIRALMKAGHQWLDTTHRKSLKMLISIGEFLSPNAWRWYSEAVGHAKLPVVVTWLDPELGSAVLASFYSPSTIKPACAGGPLFAMKPVLMNETSQQPDTSNNAEGVLCLAEPWPTQASTIYQDHQTFFDTYFKPYPGFYFTEDALRRDEDGEYWVVGPLADTIHVEGHRLGTFEIECALTQHDKVDEAAVVAVQHKKKGEGIHAFVVLSDDTNDNHDELKSEISIHLVKELGELYRPEAITVMPSLPKTHSGKTGRIKRDMLREIQA
jgi:acetyl-CoA synthetase